MSTKKWKTNEPPDVLAVFFVYRLSWCVNHNKRKHIMKRKIRVNNNLDHVIQIKKKWAAMDMKLREEALNKLPISEREVYSFLDTDTLLDKVNDYVIKKESMN